MQVNETSLLALCTHLQTIPSPLLLIWHFHGLAYLSLRLHEGLQPNYQDNIITSWIILQSSSNSNSSNYSSSSSLEFLIHLLKLSRMIQDIQTLELHHHINDPSPCPLFLLHLFPSPISLKLHNVILSEDQAVYLALTLEQLSIHIDSSSDIASSDILLSPNVIWKQLQSLEWKGNGENAIDMSKYPWQENIKH